MVVLFIDDDIDDFEMFREAFRQVHPEGRIIHQIDCTAALRFLRTHSRPSPDFIFLDVNMPLMNGLECLRELKADAALRDIPVIMYSTYIHPNEKEKYRKLGAIDSFQKPNAFTEMKSIIRGLARNAG